MDDMIGLLIRLRAEIVRLSHEVKFLGDLSSISRVRTSAPLLANKMRDYAMASDLVAACERSKAVARAKAHRDGKETKNGLRLLPVDKNGEKGK